jgi:hypothetical protein
LRLLWCQPDAWQDAESAGEVRRLQDCKHRVEAQLRQKADRLGKQNDITVYVDVEAGEPASTLIKTANPAPGSSADRRMALGKRLHQGPSRGSGHGAHLTPSRAAPEVARLLDLPGWRPLILSSPYPPDDGGAIRTAAGGRVGRSRKMVTFATGHGHVSRPECCFGRAVPLPEGGSPLAFHRRRPPGAGSKEAPEDRSRCQAGALIPGESLWLSCSIRLRRSEPW